MLCLNTEYLILNGIRTIFQEYILHVKTTVHCPEHQVLCYN